MLVRLLPEQVAAFWEAIKYSVEGSLPPIANESYDKMNRILESLMNETMQCWVSYREEGESRKLEGIMITTATSDFCSGVRNLLIYTLYGFDLTDESWSSGFATLSKWAKSIGCNRIIAYTDVDRIKEVVNKLGGEAKYTLISIPL